MPLPPLGVAIANNDIENIQPLLKKFYTTIFDPPNDIFNYTCSLCNLDIISLLLINGGTSIYNIVTTTITYRHFLSLIY